jgi:hypothetical protein
MTFGNGHYFGPVCIGTPPRVQKMIIDTGSPQSWIITSEVKSPIYPDTSKFYDMKTSKTYAPHVSKSGFSRFNKTYADEGVALEAALIRDSVSLGSLKADNFIMGGIDKIYLISEKVPKYLFNGLIGLAPRSEIIAKQLPDMHYIIHEMKQQGKLSSSLVGIMFTGSTMDNDGGEIIIGGTNEALYDKKAVKWTSFYSFPGIGVAAPSVVLDGVYVGDRLVPLTYASNGQPKNYPYLAAFDTGASNLGWLMSMADAPVVKNMICSSKNPPSLTFAFGGHNYTMNPEEYMLPDKSKSCEERTQIATSSEAGDPFVSRNIIFGGFFMRKFYAIVDYDKNRVGFAPLKKLN